MIHVSIKGRIAKKHHIIHFIGDTFDYLMPRLRRNVDIDIEIVNKIIENPTHYAQCSGDYRSAEIILCRYDENGNRFSLDEMMLNLAHELVHAKQYFKRELSPVRQTWKGKDHSKTSYARAPWEREAYGKEIKIYNMFWCGREHFIE